MTTGDRPPTHPAAPPSCAARVAGLVRLPLQYLGLWLMPIVLLLTASALFASVDVPGPLLGATAGIAVVAVLSSAALTSASPLDRRAPLVVESPVRGRWQALNSPATRVPSHGTHAYGQIFAIDLVHRPVGIEHPEFGTTRETLPPDAFSGFGEPVFAAADGVVVRAHDRQNDHRSRSGWVSLIFFMLVESAARSLGSPSKVVGNHLVIRLVDGTHLVYAHLKRGSLRVGTGDAVSTGDQLAECGNTGNSTEPHLHIHRQHSASVLTAVGLPWAIRDGGGRTDGFPENQHFLNS